MKTIFATLAAVALALPASATPRHPHYTNGGQCAGAEGSGCRYTLEIVNPDEVMVVVPGLENLGPSRLSTVQWCQKIEGTNNWQSLITDADFDLMEACLIEHT